MALLYFLNGAKLRLIIFPLVRHHHLRGNEAFWWNEIMLCPTLHSWSGCPVAIQLGIFFFFCGIPQQDKAFYSLVSSLLYYIILCIPLFCEGGERARVPRYPSGISRRGGLWEKIVNIRRGERERYGRRRKGRETSRWKSACAGSKEGGRLHWSSNSRESVSSFRFRSAAVVRLSLLFLHLSTHRYTQPPPSSSSNILSRRELIILLPTSRPHSSIIIRPTGCLYSSSSTTLLHLFSILATFFFLWADSTLSSFFFPPLLTWLLERRNVHNCVTLQLLLCPLFTTPEKWGIVVVVCVSSISI